MQFSQGDRLGPYAISGLLGAGGMGAVYRARDPRLERDVALKVLHPDAMFDAERRARFISEAKAVSALNHPNIVTVHDIGTEGDVVYMVMELVGGQPLDRILSSGAMRLSEVLRIGAQVADACASAHAAGIVHRDLKPANIMVQPDGRARILDFGIAKVIERSDDPLRTTAPTAGHTQGMVLGTASYMSPEQAEGRPLDGRSDIFSLGAVLYEMVTGQRAFRGESPITVMAAVLQQEPEPPASLRQDLPPELGRLLLRCLRKDPARRVQSMADLTVALEDLRDEIESGKLTGPLPAASSLPRSRGRRAVRLGGTVAATVALAAAVWALGLRRVPAPIDDALQPLPLTSYAGAEASATFSPDGGQFAFMWTGEQGDNPDIYVSLVGGGSPLRLTTDPLADGLPVWSPDGRQIAFMRRLDRDSVAVLVVPPLGGPERTIGRFKTRVSLQGAQLASVSWSPDSRYLFMSAAEAPDRAHQISRVAIDTGNVTPVATMEGPGIGYIMPAVSPDGRTLAALRYEGDAGDIALWSLSDAYAVSNARTLPRPGVNGIHIAWTADGRDLLISSGLFSEPLYRVPASGGATQRLAWVGPGASNASVHRSRMAFDRSFRDTNLVRVALSSIQTGRPVLERIAQSSFRDVAPQYSPDGTRLAYYSNRSGSSQIWTANTDGTLARPLTSLDPLAVTGTPRWSPDGRQIAFDSNAGGTYNIYVISADGGQPRALTSGGTSNFIPAWSPDGRWIYFSSDRSGTEQIWRLPAAGGAPEQMTTEGGTGPTVSPDGRWLYFTRNDGADGLWRMPIEGGEPIKLVDVLFRFDYAVAPDGVYFVTPGPNAEIKFRSFATGSTQGILALDRPVDLGLALSPDGRFLIFAQVDYAGRDLMLVEGFK